LDKTHGDLKDVGLPRLLHLIYKMRDRTAALDISRKPIKKRFFFQNGIPVGATSNILGEVLGRLLIEEGVISQEQYEKSLEAVLSEKRKHGEVLISMGLLTPEELEKFLALQLKRRLLKIFGWNEGAYHYVRGAASGAGMTPYPIHPASLIFEGISLGFYPAKRMEQDLEEYLDKALAASPATSIYTLDDFNLNIQEKRFIENFDGKKTLREIIAISDLLRNRVLSLSLSFIITGLVVDVDDLPDEEELEGEGGEGDEQERPASGGESRLNAEILFIRAKGALADGDFSGALETLRTINELSPAEGEYRAYLGWAMFNDNPDEAAEAEAVIKEALELNNELDSAWYFLGRIALASNETDKAEEAFRNAVEKNPWMLEAVVGLKRLAMGKGLGQTADAAQRGVYADRYRLAADPFTEAPEPRYLLEYDGLVRALDAVIDAVKRKTGPLLLTAEAGAGKTTAALELLTRLAHEKLLVAFVLDPPERELAMVQLLNEEVGSPTDSNAIKDALLNLGMRVSQNKVQGGRTMIIIDRAHLLSRGCMKLIQYLARLKTLQIILLAEPSFEEMLKDEDFEELDRRLTTRVTLAPLSAAETGEYINKRLSLAPRTGAGPITPLLLTDEAAEAVHRVSGGLPGEINRNAALLLTKAAELDTCVLDLDLAGALWPSPDSGDGGRARGDERFEELEIEGLDEIAFDEEPESSPVEFATSSTPLEDIMPEPAILEEAKVIEEPALEKEDETPAGQGHEGRDEAPAPVPPRRGGDDDETERGGDDDYGVGEGREATPVSAEREGAETRREDKRSPVRLIILLVLVVIAGLVTGSMTRIFYWPWGAVEEEPMHGNSAGGQTQAPLPPTMQGPERGGGLEGAPAVPGTDAPMPAVTAEGSGEPLRIPVEKDEDR